MNILLSIPILFALIISSCSFSDNIYDFDQLNKCKKDSTHNSEREIEKIYLTEHGIYINKNTYNEIKIFKLIFVQESDFSKIMERIPDVGDVFYVRISGQYIERKKCHQLDDNILLVTAIEEVQ